MLSVREPRAQKVIKCGWAWPGKHFWVIHIYLNYIYLDVLEKQANNFAETPTSSLIKMHLFNSLNVFSFSSLNMLKTVVFKDFSWTSGPMLSHFPWMEYESHSPCKWIMLLFLSTSNDFLPLLLKTRQCWQYAVMTLILVMFWGLSFPSDKQLIC